MNMPVMDRDNHKNNSTTTCHACGGSMKHKVGTISRVIHDEQIRIHKVPYYECLQCGEISFDLSSNISSVLATTCRLGQAEVDYQEYFRR